ncbi:MAG: hypothetical protein H6586_03850 [Flavobacteriales bacterium]|nr:hypothetical protein [Flavobacteriales bacterium]
MTLKKNYILFPFLLFHLCAFAQLGGVNRDEVINEDNVFLDGVISEYYSGDNLSGVKISAISDGKTVASGTSDENGKYQMVLQYDKTYTISYSKSGFIAKSITIDTHGVPDMERQKVPDVSAEITLIQPNECIKAEMLDKPIGIAKYFPEKNRIDWDMVTSMPQLAALNEMLDNCAEELEKKDKEYEEAMKEADKLFAKQNWEEAKAGYQKALTIFPKEAEPKNRLQLIETELAKKAEIEKQKAEEQARAEAEAKAKAEAEVAAKKVEEERLAKEKAEQEAIVRAEAEAKEKAKAEAAAKKAEEERIAKEKAEREAIAKAEAEKKAKEEALSKAEEEKLAKEQAKKEEEERLAKEKAEKEALAQQEAEAKENAKAEAEAKKLAEEQAKKEEQEALTKAKEEEKAKLLAQQQAKQSAEEEAKALKEQEAAKKREEEERIAKEKAAELVKQAEEERQENKIKLLEENEVVKTYVAEQEEENKPGKAKGKPSITIKGSNKGRHLYVKPNKYRYGHGPNFKKKIIF